jgi:hypothetical protein
MSVMVPMMVVMAVPVMSGMRAAAVRVGRVLSGRGGGVGVGVGVIVGHEG